MYFVHVCTDLYSSGTAEIRCNHGRDGVRNIDHELFLPQREATAKPPRVALIIEDVESVFGQ
jgi:hypothetical protein